MELDPTEQEKRSLPISNSFLASFGPSQYIILLIPFLISTTSKEYTIIDNNNMPVLRDVILLPQLATPLWNNVASAFIMVLFFRWGIEITGWLRARFGWKQQRQILQMNLAASVIFWPLFDTEDWSWRLNALLPATMLVRIIYKVPYIHHATCKQNSFRVSCCYRCCFCGRSNRF